MKDRRYGEVPQGQVFFAACDANYFKKFAPAFVSSIGKHTSTNIHIHVINPDEEVFALACYLNSRVSQHVTYTFQDSDLSKYTTEQQRALYASLRFLVAPFLLSYVDSLMILDIDCMVMKNFDFPTHPVGYFPREPLPGTVGWEQEGTKCAAGMVFLDKTAVLIANGIAETLDGLELKWFNDQIALNHVMSQVPEEFVKKFDGNMMDWEFKEGTAIWTGKGPRKYENKTYVAKQKEYYDKIMDAPESKVVLAPRLDIPFKQFDIVRAGSVNEPIRKHWKNFIDQHVEEGYYKVSSPRWMFNAQLEKYFPNLQEMLVPHVERHNWGGTDKSYFYMQTVFPWLFTVDHQGWAGGAAYINTFDPESEYSEEAFENMQEYIAGGSKFQHLQSKTTNWEGIRDNYIIVPLQLPHDETIKYHSNITVPEFVEALCEYADNNIVMPQLVFKGHPVNLKAMEPLKEIIAKYKNVHYIADGNFHDLVRKSQGMWVLNGGSGQEAMLLEKPVMCFGDCDYAPAVVRGDIKDMESSFNKFFVLIASKTIEGNPHWVNRLEAYKRWYDWYINNICIDTRK